MAYIKPKFKIGDEVRVCNPKREPHEQLTNLPLMLHRTGRVSHINRGTLDIFFYIIDVPVIGLCQVPEYCLESTSPRKVI